MFLVTWEAQRQGEADIKDDYIMALFGSVAESLDNEKRAALRPRVFED